MARSWQCSVYGISDGIGNMKFGVAKDIPSRMKTLQIGNAHPLQLLFEVVCVCRCPRSAANAAYQVEHHIHGCIEHLRMTGEWFAIDYYEALHQIADSADCIANDPKVLGRGVEIEYVVVHKQEKDHLLWWPTSDVAQRGLAE